MLNRFRFLLSWSLYCREKKASLLEFLLRITGEFQKNDSDHVHLLASGFKWDKISIQAAKLRHSHVIKSPINGDNTDC